METHDHMIGTCDACGRMGEVDRRRITMFRSHGKYGKVDREELDCTLCPECQRKVSPDGLNLLLACLVGICFGLSPCLSHPRVMWCLESFGRVAQLLPGFLALPALLWMSKCRSRPLARLPSYQTLKAQGYSLGHKDMGKLMGMALLAAAVSAFAAFAVLTGVRAQEDGYGKVTGRITDCAYKSSVLNCKGSVTYDICAQYAYDYAVEGTTHVGREFEYWLVDDIKRFVKPLKVGDEVTVRYDRTRPARCRVRRSSPESFRKLSIVCFVIVCIACLVRILFWAYSARIRQLQLSSADELFRPEGGAAAESASDSGLLVMIEALAFVLGCVVMGVWPGFWVNDPIFRRAVPFFGYFNAVLMGTLCTTVGLAVRRIAIPESGVRRTLLFGLPLVAAFVVHLLCASVYWTGGISIPACTSGFVMRFMVVLMVAVGAVLIALMLGAVALAALPSCVRIWTARGVDFARYVKNVVFLSALGAVIGLLVYELLVLWRLT